MIRHLTTMYAYEKVLQDGVIKARRKNGREKDVISFETFNNNDVLVSIFLKEKGKNIIAIYLDENRLENDGFIVYKTNSSDLKSRQESKYTTKYENIVRYKGDKADKDYRSIGEYVHVQGDIPVKYIEYIKEYNYKIEVIKYE
ncbi:hypothetical protein [Clostridium sp. UBA7503]|uniref:hypothetical protein n=1 Tax=Clostridium sp. UBA7503 TaxID=1946377 RepID=UPI00321648F0